MNPQGIKDVTEFLSPVLQCLSVILFTQAVSDVLVTHAVRNYRSEALHSALLRDGPSSGEPAVENLNSKTFCL